MYICICICNIYIFSSGWKLGFFEVVFVVPDDDDDLLTFLYWDGEELQECKRVKIKGLR